MPLQTTCKSQASIESVPGHSIFVCLSKRLFAYTELSFFPVLSFLVNVCHVGWHSELGCGGPRGNFYFSCSENKTTKNICNKHWQMTMHSTAHDNWRTHAASGLLGGPTLISFLNCMLSPNYFFLSAYPVLFSAQVYFLMPHLVSYPWVLTPIVLFLYSLSGWWNLFFASASWVLLGTV